MADYKQLCADLVDALTAHGQPDDDAVGYVAGLLTRARAELAEPEPEGPTNEELLEAVKAGVASFPLRHPEALNLSAVEYEVELEIRKARAVLARCGRPEPISVTESLPGPEDCDAEGKCWWFCPQCPGEYPHWVFAKEAYCAPTHWLPPHALTSTPFS